MKTILVTLSLLLWGPLSSSAQTSIAEQIAQKVAQRMGDSLQLSSDQKASVYTINMQLYHQKMNVWQQYGHSDSLTRVNLQRVENSRDSLYRPVLSEAQFLRYRQRKNVLLNNN